MSSASQPPASTVIIVPCTLQICPFYLALFVPMLLIYLAAMSGGLFLEIIGYGGRLMLLSNLFNHSAFLRYLICLTIGPAFVTTAIYICFGRVIVVCDAVCRGSSPKPNKMDSAIPVSHVVSLGSFMALCADYMWWLRRQTRVLQPASWKDGWKCKGFLFGMKPLMQLECKVPDRSSVSTTHGGI
ncbi:hypothetical protein BDV29DRAFT_195855 [Aspergillus leporis]|uniref:RTA1 like protein-domain-containing protein n=1 Tax=Aspergillus leporis TaxID=41062 RepID=A0A5N5WI67_9EURO|nr:hypothetical protein BDV29DRAFT_195855 [Aspergillus leporis]